MAKAGAAHHREPLSGHRAKTPLATFGPHPRLATYRPIGSPLGRRTFAHWPHTAGSHSLAKRGATLTAPPGRRAFAYWPPTATAPPTGHLCPPPPPLAREADGTHRGKGSHALTGLPLATYWPSGEAPTGQRDGRGSLWPHGSSSPPLPATYGQRGHPSLATKGRGGGLCPASPPGGGDPPYGLCGEGCARLAKR